MKVHAAPALFAALLAVCHLAFAQSTSASASVWRCGPDGRVFSDKPCAEGRALDTPAPRPAEDVAAAQKRLERDQRAAAEAADRRLALESTLAQGPANLGPARPAHAPAVKAPEKAPKHSSKKRHHRLADDDTLRAVAPASRRGKG